MYLVTVGKWASKKISSLTNHQKMTQSNKFSHAFHQTQRAHKNILSLSS
jgi:hypothetical protein